MAKHLVVVGAQWGDEGKGKIIDGIGEDYDVFVRFNGGANAGHTMHTPEGQKIVSHLIPCGVALGKECVIARGVYFDLDLFIEEQNQVKHILDTDLDIVIDENASLCTPYHLFFERWAELKRGKKDECIGTTGKGIGAHAALRKMRVGVTVGDLRDKDRLYRGMAMLYNFLEPILQWLHRIDGLMIPKPMSVVERMIALAPQVTDECWIDDTRAHLFDLAKDKRILFEGAQAVGLDSEWGTWPHVSAGNSVSAGASLGTGLPPSMIDEVLMVAKVLPTRVGNGPFPTEISDRDSAARFAKAHPGLFDPGPARDEFLETSRLCINEGSATSALVAQYFQILGGELGATTGRGRSVGYFDIPWLRYAAAVCGATQMALTRFDMLSGIESIPVARSYVDEQLSSFHLDEAEPQYQLWPCWEENICGVQSLSDLPGTAQHFVESAECLVDVPITMVGTGPGRHDLIRRNRK